MLSLQTIVEELGAACGGRVWVMVTSQEAIDNLSLPVGNDFSKIQGRFNTRLSLSSSSVDEVIQCRVLEKTAPAADMLAQVYEQDAAVLKNNFTFEGGSALRPCRLRPTPRILWPATRLWATSLSSCRRDDRGAQASMSRPSTCQRASAPC